MANAATKPSFTLYHYTDREGKDAIRASKFIQMSTDPQLNAKFGVGVYLTSMSPLVNSREDIIKKYSSGIISQWEHNTHYVFEVKLDPETDLDAVKKGDIYVFGQENLKSHLLKNWTLYDWTLDEPKKKELGEFVIPQQSGVPADQ